MEQLVINLDVNQTIDIGSYINIILQDEITEQRIHIYEEVTKLRTGPGQISYNSDSALAVENIVTALNLDFGGVIKSSSTSSKKAQIVGVLPNLAVVNIQVFNPVLGGDFAIIETEIVPINNFEITNIEFLASETNLCEKIKVRVTTSSPMLALCNNIQCVPINDTVGEIECFRGVSLTINCTSLGPNVQYASQNIITPPLLETNSFPISLSIINTVNGGSVSALVLNAPILNVEYSLDNITWQSSPTFSGLVNGNYEMFIRDKYGCKKIKPFSIVDYNFNVPISFISKENSIRFKEPNGEYQTDENSKYCESRSRKQYGYVQEFLSSDIITTQLRSNYENITVLVTDIDSNDQIPITPIRVTNNLYNKAKYNQVKSYQLNDSQFGLYFESGSVLNYDTGLVIDTYNLNGALPIWARLGNIINVNGSGYFIDNIAFDESIDAEVIILNGTAPTGNIIVSCEYNIQDYEVYEFTIDMADFFGKRIKIDVINEDINFGVVTWSTEEINVVDSLSSDYIEVRYWNSTNTNILYSTGIRHLLRLPYNTIKSSDTDSSENYSTDTNSHLINSKILEVTEFEFLPFPLELYRKLKIALSLDNVFIDGVGYTKNAEFSKEVLGSSNLYKLTAQMVKNGNVYTSNQITNDEVIVSQPNINLPSLISIADGGFVSF